MRFELHFFHHHDDGRLDAVLRAVHSLYEDLRMKLQDIQDQLADAAAKATAETTVVQSAVALITGLSGTVAALKAEVDAAVANAADPAALQSISDGLGGISKTLSDNASALGAAVAANTVAAPPAA